jgi:cytochrome c biogenesis protein CcdA
MLKSIKLIVLILSILLLCSTTFALVDQNDTVLSIQEEDSESVNEEVDETTEEDSSDESSDTINTDVEACVYYFYGTDCEDCEEVDMFLEELQDDYPNLRVEYFEVHYNKANMGLLEDYAAAYNLNLDSQGIPIVFMVQTYFTGKDAIFSFLEESIKNQDDNICPTLNEGSSVGLVGNMESQFLLDTLGIGSVTWAAFTNIASFCGLALILLYLLLGLTVLKKKEEDERLHLKKKNEKLLRKTVLFIIGVFMVFLFSGLGWLNWVFFSDKAEFFAKIIVIVSFIMSLIVMKTFLLQGEIIPRKYYQKFVPHMRKVSKYTINPPCFLLYGILTGLFLAVCWTGQYTAITYLFADSATRWQVMPFFIWHQMLLLLPLIVIFGMVHWQIIKIRKIEDEKQRIHQYELLAFILGALMFVLSILAILLI